MRTEQAVERQAGHENLLRDLVDSLKNMAEVWVTICSAFGWDPDHYTQYTAARAVIARANQEVQS